MARDLGGCPRGPKVYLTKCLSDSIIMWTMCVFFSKTAHFVMKKEMTGGSGDYYGKEHDRFRPV